MNVRGPFDVLYRLVRFKCWGMTRQTPTSDATLTTVPSSMDSDVLYRLGSDTLILDTVYVTVATRRLMYMAVIL